MSCRDSISAIDAMIQLHDGRTLGYLEYGNPTGKALFYFHGHPGSRFEAGFLAQAASTNGVRLIGVDRPGLGRSTYKPGRHFLDWPDDLVELADRLHIERFAVVGFSGGGPYALACALKLPQRLTACGIVSGVAPSGRLLSFLAIWLPWLILPMTKRFFKTEAQASRTLTRLAGRWVEADRKALADPKVRATMAASLTESLRQGSRGAAYDGTLVGGRNWGFALEEIRFPELYLWHGERDDTIPVGQARKVAERMAQCKASYYPDDGHISTIVNHGAEIVAALLA